MGKLENPPPSQTVADFLGGTNLYDTSGMEQVDWQPVIKAINDEYLYWDKAKYKIPKEVARHLAPAAIWNLAKVRRHLVEKIIVVAGCKFLLSQTDKTAAQLHEFDLHLGGSLGGQETIAETDRNRYLIGSIMEESIASSQIEGAVTSRVVAKEMLQKNRPPRTKSERMIVNNYLTIQHLVRHKQEPLTLDNLLELHRLMTAETLDNPGEAGQLRQHDDIHVVDVVESEIVHTPPTHTTLPTFVDELCRFFNDETPDFFLHPIVRASVIHFFIGYFHPFTDGNGRTARGLFYWYLLRKGYWLTEYLSISRVIMQSRSQYYRAFQCVEADENDLTYFVHYQVKTLTQAYADLKKYIDRKNQERQGRLALQRKGLTLRQAQIVDWFRRDAGSTVSIKEVEVRLGVSNQTARNDMKTIATLGFVTELVVNRKERHYIRGPRFEE